MLDRRQGSREHLQAERQPAPSRGRDGGERPDAGDPWRGSLAAEGFDPVDLGGVSDLAQRDDAEPGTALARLSQALGPPAPLCPERSLTAAIAPNPDTAGHRFIAALLPALAWVRQRQGGPLDTETLYAS